MKYLLPFILVLTVLVIAACNSSKAETTSTPPGPGKGGSMPPYYSTPVLLNAGDYWPSDVPFASIADEGRLLQDQDAKKPTFEGTVAGIRLFSFAHVATDPSVDRKWCVVDNFVTTDELTINYLPGGTYANGPEYAGICSDGSISFVEREFTTKHGSFAVIQYHGEASFGEDASTARVHAQSINGVDGVVISPVTDAGYGRGWAAYRTPQGVLIVDGQQLPVSELTQILGSVKCSACPAFRMPSTTPSLLTPKMGSSDSQSPMGYNVTLMLYHPSGSGTVNEQLTCGWHSGACPASGPPPGGAALDWQPTDCSGGNCNGESTWIRLIGIGPNGVRAAGADTFHQDTPCKGMTSNIVRTSDGAVYGTIHQYHSGGNPNHNWMNIFVSVAGSQNSMVAGYILPHLQDNCSSTGDHTHQFYAAGPNETWHGQNSVSVYNTCNYGVPGQPCGSPFPIWNTYEYAIQFVTA